MSTGKSINEEKGNAVLPLVSISELSLGDKLHLNAGKDCPRWLNSFAGYVTKIGRVRVKVRIPVDDDRERWISISQLSLNDQWER